MRIPNTPGSRRMGEAITGMGRSRRNGVADCRAARKRRHHWSQTIVLAAKPHSQTANSRTETQFEDATVEGRGSDATDSFARGLKKHVFTFGIPRAIRPRWRLTAGILSDRDTMRKVGRVREEEKHTVL